MAITPGPDSLKRIIKKADEIDAGLLTPETPHEKGLSEYIAHNPTGEIVKIISDCLEGKK